MRSSRVKNTKRNIFFSYASAGVTIVFQFVARTAIMRTFGSEYLGLSSLISSVLGVLNMVELGFSGAVVYNLYKPIAQGDDEAVCSILAFYRRVYRIVGTTILVSGLACLPFLPTLIRGGIPDGISVNKVYLLYLANTVASYLVFGYMNALLTALQRLDLTKIAYLAVSVLQYASQLAALYVLHDFYLFVVALIGGTVLQNVATFAIARHVFPQYTCRGAIPKEIRTDIVSRVKGIMIGRISSVTYSTFDSIILSTFLGLASVAVYNNYLTVYNGVSNLVSMLRGAMEASVGDSIASESLEKNYGDLHLWQFLFSAIATVGSACLMCLYQPFMELWMGKEMLLPLRDVLLLTVLFSVVTVQHSYFMYLSGNGLWWEMRWPYIVSTVANLTLNLTLGQTLGTTGVILSTTASTVIFSYYWQSKIIFKLYFKQNLSDYHRRQMGFFVTEFFAVGIAYAICRLIMLHSVLGLVIRLPIAIGVSLTVLYVKYHRSEDFEHAITLVGRQER